ncbi:MAG: DUF2232 domain-containing protein [Pseudomonadota bacterium]
MPINILVGAITGIASAILFLGLVSGNSLGVLSLVLMALPVTIAGLGWSRVTALASVGVASVIIGVAAAPIAAVYFAGIIGLPLVGITYLAMLRRDVVDDRGQQGVEWYPIGRLVVAITLWAGSLSALLVGAILSRGNDLQTAMRAFVDYLFDTVFTLPPDAAVQLTDARRDEIAATFTSYIPFALSTSWMLVAVVSVYLSAVIVHRSGQLQRPWPDLSTMALPRLMNLIFMAAAIATFAGGTVGEMAKCFVWAIAFAYVLQGLAILHQTSRGRSFRGLLLFVVYAGLFFVQPISTMIIALIGLAEPVSPLRRQMTELGPPPGRGPPGASGSGPSQGPGPPGGAPPS